MLSLPSVDEPDWWHKSVGQGALIGWISSVGLDLTDRFNSWMVYLLSCGILHRWLHLICVPILRGILWEEYRI